MDPLDQELPASPSSEEPAPESPHPPEQPPPQDPLTPEKPLPETSDDPSQQPPSQDPLPPELTETSDDPSQQPPLQDPLQPEQPQPETSGSSLQPQPETSGSSLQPQPETSGSPKQEWRPQPRPLRQRALSAPQLLQESRAGPSSSAATSRPPRPEGSPDLSRYRVQPQREQPQPYRPVRLEPRPPPGYCPEMQEPHGVFWFVVKRVLVVGAIIAFFYFFVHSATKQ